MLINKKIECRFATIQMNRLLNVLTQVTNKNENYSDGSLTQVRGQSDDTAKKIFSDVLHDLSGYLAHLLRREESIWQ